VLARATDKVYYDVVGVAVEYYSWPEGVPGECLGGHDWLMDGGTMSA